MNQSISCITLIVFIFRSALAHYFLILHRLKMLSKNRIIYYGETFLAILSDPFHYIEQLFAPNNEKI